MAGGASGRIVKIGRASYRSRLLGDGRTLSWEVNYTIEDDRGFSRREFSGGHVTKGLAEGYYGSRIDLIKAQRLYWDHEAPETGLRLSKLIEMFHDHGEGTKASRSVQMDRLATRWFVDYIKERRMGDPEIEALGRRELDGYMAWRSKAGRAPITTNRERAALRRMFGLAVEWGYLEANPVVGVKKLKEPEQDVVFLELPAQMKLLEAAGELASEEQSQCPHLRAIIALALSTGMRKSEILSLRWHQIDWTRREVRLANRPDWKTKSRRNRTIGLTDFAVSELKIWKAWISSETGRARERAASRKLTLQLREKASARLDLLIRIAPRPDGLVFPSTRVFGPEGEQRPMDNIRHSLDKATARAKINPGGLHRLRHSFAVAMVRAGTPLPILAQLLGHASTSTTEIYLRFYPNEGARQVDKMPVPVCGAARVMDAPPPAAGGHLVGEGVKVRRRSSGSGS